MTISATSNSMPVRRSMHQTSVPFASMWLTHSMHLTTSVQSQLGPQLSKGAVVMYPSPSMHGCAASISFLTTSVLARRSAGGLGPRAPMQMVSSAFIGDPDRPVQVYHGVSNFRKGVDVFSRLLKSIRECGPIRKVL